jgi:hypothetical protein
MTGGGAALDAWLRWRAEPVFGVLDAARDPAVYPTLLRGQFGQESLFEGLRAAALCDVAPYLVPLALDSPLLAAMTGAWWGRSIGFVLTSRASMAEVLDRLREMLTVRTDDERRMVFRFYDPRVLRVFLPIANPRQASTLFGDGEIGAVACEGAEPQAVHLFTADTEGKVNARMLATQEGERHGRVAG